MLILFYIGLGVCSVGLSITLTGILKKDNELAPMGLAIGLTTMLITALILAYTPLGA